MVQAIVFLPLLGAILAGLIALFGAHARHPSGDEVEHHDHGHGAHAHAAVAHDDHGHAHDDHGHGHHEPHESPLVMLVPLMVLSLGAVFGIFAGFLLGSVVVLAGVVALHLWGTWAGGIVLIAALMVFMGELNPLRIAVVALPTIAITWAIVSWALQIQLP